MENRTMDISIIGWRMHDTLKVAIEARSPYTAKLRQDGESTKEKFREAYHLYGGQRWWHKVYC